MGDPLKQTYEMVIGIEDLGFDENGKLFSLR